MLRMKSVSVLATLAFALAIAPMALAQGTSTTTTTDTKSAAPAKAITSAPAKSMSTTSKASTMKSKAAATPAIDINSATKEELEKVPGIGDATADKILAGRPFKSKSELVAKGIVTRAQYAKLRAHVTAKQEAVAK
jgi:DNA uptake protein ComE-like DNA-binding protein